MLICLISSVMIIMVSTIIMSISSILSKKTFTDREKSSPFECGFDPKSSARIPFSLQFFLIAVIFLIFDVEITLLLPIIMSFKMTKIFTFSMISTFFIIILLSGLYHEWNQGALKWAY
uniref:NADH-ubiquinone oxidoreductase chain 3 n=1 Tax=Elateroidea sp. 9 KM-2017 TaxID=2219432 RepID=A0A346RJ39_9COLE|nr:NADH dehydrogenase subunit 3 [Elateroidea sp. 9 KM-2017]